MIDLAEAAVHKYLAVVDPALCVSCGICLGSCSDNALKLGGIDNVTLEMEVQQRIAFAQQRSQSADDVEIVFACSRFVNQGARPYLDRQVNEVKATHAAIEVIAIPCAGAVPPDLLVDALEAGAAEVRLVGCPPDDCANREGNLWAEQRLTRERPPRLRKKYAEVPISAVWLPPDQFDAALKTDIQVEETGWLESRRLIQSLSWKNLIPAFVLLGAILLIQIFTNDLIYLPTDAQSSTLEIVLPDAARPLGWSPWIGHPYQGYSYELWLGLNEQTILLTTFASQDLFTSNKLGYFERLALAPGTYNIQLWLKRSNSETTYLFHQSTSSLTRGEILRLNDQTAPFAVDHGGNIAR
jgi:ferredoxin